jgi:hypothetical protein
VVDRVHAWETKVRLERVARHVGSVTHPVLGTSTLDL